ncbi:MAG: hypothetical protein R3C18_22310 [Planctomycetaceae bacterium]
MALTRCIVSANPAAVALPIDDQQSVVIGTSHASSYPPAAKLLLRGILVRSNHAPFLILMLLTLSVGCRGTSKYGMDHAAYVKKYDRPYERGEKLWRMGKQMVDARHIAGQSGGTATVSGGASRKAGGIGGELGGVQYVNPWLSVNGGLNGMLTITGGDGFALLGVRAGARLQTPTRLAPYAGVGAYAGIGPSSKPVPVPANPFEERDDYVTQGIVAVYPEAGIHWWATGRVGVSAGSQYWMTSEGDGFWYHGLTLTVLADGKPPALSDRGTTISLEPAEATITPDGKFSVGGLPPEIEQALAEELQSEPTLD